jgi:hypothetical protein
MKFRVSTTCSLTLRKAGQGEGKNEAGKGTKSIAIAIGIGLSASEYVESAARHEAVSMKGAIDHR